MKKKEQSVIGIVLGASVLLCAIKFLAFFSTRSVAIFSDALESLVNIAAGMLAYYSIYLAGLPRDRNHPYGHGKVEFLSIGVEGAMLFIAGGIILFQTVEYLLHPRVLAQLDFGVLLIALTSAANLGLGQWLRASGTKLSSITLSGHGSHLRSDAISSGALVIALGIIRFTHWHWLDPVTSALLGIFILANAYRLIRPSVSGLMDETDLRLLDEVVMILAARRKKDWVDVHNLRVQQYGNNYHIDCHLTLPYYLDLVQAHEEIRDLSLSLSNEISIGEVECFVHPDPCIPSCCHYCLKADCPVRSHPFTGKIPWTRETLLPNHKHGETLLEKAEE
ncbi:MAG TPA: cation diffusion facilitator family transporter [Chitinophagaceae bacterium]|nr:cation diffusion facilitator family transporter [Chitinophagaceae bacterium]